MKAKTKKVLVSLLSCGFIVSATYSGYATYQLHNLQLGLNEKSVTIEQLETENNSLYTRVEEVEVLIQEKEKSLSEALENLELARQENERIVGEKEQLRAEIKRSEELRVSRGASFSADFNINSNVTTLRIEDGDLLDKGLLGSLKGLGWTFVQAGQRYNIDPLFLAAIAAQESGWGNASSNLFGSIAYTGGSHADQIYEMARDLRVNYINERGLTTPALIQPRYCPSPTDWHQSIVNCANTITNGIRGN